MKVAHVVKRIEMVDDDIKQLKRLESQLGKNKKYANPIIISIEKQINLLLAERIKYLELKIDNPPAFLDLDDDLPEEKQSKSAEPARVSRIKTRSPKDSQGKSEPASGKSKIKKRPSVDSPRFLKEADEENETDMLTQDIIDKKFEEARKKLLKEAGSDLDQKKKGISRAY